MSTRSTEHMAGTPKVPGEVPARMTTQEWQTRIDVAVIYGWTDLDNTHFSARIPGTVSDSYSAPTKAGLLYRIIYSPISTPEIRCPTHRAWCSSTTSYTTIATWVPIFRPAMASRQLLS